MRMSHVEDAHKLCREITSMRAELERVQQARCFKLEYKEAFNHGRFEPVAHVDGVSADASGAYGQLGAALKAAAESYLLFHIQSYTEKLAELGVTEE